MSFTGDLEHLPIVDVIQLIYSSRKSGTLSIQNQKGKSQLVFSDGYFVSANHLNNSVRIGQILVENKFLLPEDLEKALQQQSNAGAARKPLIATLIEQGLIKPEDAYKGLESLIEMTVVEVLTWKNGTFALDVNKTEMNDEYRYFPDTLKQEILINAQGILMDALRIYDERMRDGTLEELFFSDEAPEPAAEIEGQPITADLLGLDALDTITKKIPDHFSGLKDNDLSDEHSRVIAEVLNTLPKKSQDDLCTFLTELSSKVPPGEGAIPPGALPLAIIVFSQDPFIKHAITSICRSKGYIVFTTDEDASLDMIIEQSFSRDLLPVLIVDDPAFIGAAYTEEILTLFLQQKRQRYPRISILQMCTSPEEQTFPPHVLDEGTDAIFPRPVLGDSSDSFVAHMASFLKSFCSVLDNSFTQPDRQAARRLKESIAALCTLSEPPDVARELLARIADLFERSVTFVVGASELTAEKGIGVTAGKDAGATGPLMYKIPLGHNSIFDEVISSRKIQYVISTDPILHRNLYAAMTPPHTSKVMIMPLVMSGRVIALFYADFGDRPPVPVQTEYLDILSRVAGLVLENAAYRKKFERLTQQR